MALIISLETSTSVSSVALYRDSNLLYSNAILKENSHSGSLVKMVKNAVELANHNLKDLNGVAISKGPGSFTGLRIGTSVAKGICFALDIPLIAVNTLESMAWEINHYNLGNMLLCPMIDARRMEVYFMIFNHHLNIIQDAAAKVINENSFKDLLENYELIFFGNGAEKTKKWLSQNVNAHFIDNIYPQAANVGVLAYQKYKAFDFEDLVYFEPFYLKDFIGTKSLKV
ncbi:tRNA (adenosine(37)-N6)-threonylcarbamoyltransferase complex dimerization subunit type 1 TsaB [soil metagenome]